MLIVNVIRHSFLKSPARVLFDYKRTLVAKKKPIWRDPFSGHGNYSNFEEIRNVKLTPEGFKVIYITPMFQIMKWYYISLPFLWGGFCFDLYAFITNEDYIAKLEKNFGKFSAKDKILQIGGFTILFVILHLLLSRVVVATFRKENEFRSLMYGFLGPLTKKYVPHGFQAMQQTPHSLVYNFKGKKVFLWSDGFWNIEDINSVISFNK